MNETKWVTLSVTTKELALVNEAKEAMEKLLGIKLSRNAFLKRLLFASIDRDTSLAS